MAVPRGRGESLTDSEREAFGEQALLMHAQGKTYREIAQALGVSRPTVKSLIDRALGAAREERSKAKARQLAAYRALLGEAWTRLLGFPSNSSSQNVTGLVNAARSILERIDKLTGVEAPTKTQHEVRHMDFSKLSDEDLQTFERIIRENFPELLESPEY